MRLTLTSITIYCIGTNTSSKVNQIKLASYSKNCLSDLKSNLPIGERNMVTGI